MFDRFRATFASRRGDAPAAEPWLSNGTRSVSGYAEFVAEFAGASFAGGLYRVLDATTGPSAQARVDSLGDVFSVVARGRGAATGNADYGSLRSVTLC